MQFNPSIFLLALAASVAVFTGCQQTATSDSSGSNTSEANAVSTVSNASESVESPSSSGGQQQPISLLNVSYDPTREFYVEFNQAFKKHWQEAKGQDITIEQSHGGSGKQARAVIDGLAADVVTLALPLDIDQIAKQTGKTPIDWKSRLPNGSVPYTTTIVFLVRKGNPGKIKDWSDLTKPGLQVITPNPKTSGGARLIYLAAWGYALKQPAGSQEKAKAFVSELYKNVPVLDTGARGSATTFIQRGIGDVLIAWENEAHLAMNELGSEKFELVNPSISIKAEPPVAVIDDNAKSKGVLEAANAYLDFLFSPQGQKLAAKHYYRPTKAEAADPADLARFSDIPMFTVEELFGSWEEAQKVHFNDGGTFDAIYTPGS